MKKKKDAATAPAATLPAGTPIEQARSGKMDLVALLTAAETLSQAGQTDTIIEMYRVWLERTPSPLAFAAHFNLAVVLSAASQDSEAEKSYRMAIAVNPTFAEAYLNLGTLLERLGRPEESLTLWRKVVSFCDQKVPEQKRHYIQALNNLGRLLEIRKCYEEAEEMLRLSLLADPEQDSAISHYVHLRQKQCAWPVYFDFGQVTVAALMKSTSALAMLSASNDPAVQLAASRSFVDDKVLKDAAPMAPPEGYRHDRLRIGYLSSDLCSHAVSILTAELYELHDREKVEVYAFSWSREDGSPLRARVVAAMDRYIRITDMNDQDAARLIRSHEIDILVDLHGLTLGTRPNILAYRPAPVQMTYLGFPGPTAMPAIDYVVADEFVLPPRLAAHFTEKPLYMPNCFQVNDRKRAIAPTPTKASCGLPEDKFIFCSFNNNFKFTEDIFGAWMRILRRVPDSVLWLVADYDMVRTNLRKRAEESGIDPDRLYFAARAFPAEYLARYKLADLFLDTFPFNAGTTASDALWAGLPLLTYSGEVFAARMAGSLLRAVDLPELITTSLQEYEDKAVALAAQPEAIAAMKRKLEENRLTCALFDTPRFVRDFEAKLESVAKGERIARAAAPAAAAPADAAPVAAPAPVPAAIAVTAPAPAPAIPQRAAGAPLVSIVIPSYKAEHFEQCLKSALGQTYPNIEILVSDNCPTEAIRDICARYPSVIYQRCSVIKIDNVISALYSGKGQFVKPLFDDDILHPFCVERMVSVMASRPDVEMVFSASQVIDINNMPTETRRPYQSSGSMPARGMQRSMAMGFWNFVGEFSTIMFRRQSLWNIGWKDIFRIGSHDYSRGLADVAFYCNIARGKEVFYVDEELSYFRHDKRLMSNSNISFNPDFGFCFSDYIDLAIGSHETGLLSDEELLALEVRVDSVVERLGKTFTQVGDSHGRYLAYTVPLKAARAAAAPAAIPVPA